MVETKRPIDSRRMWFNTLSVLAMALAEMMLSPELKAQISGSTYLFLGAIGALINAYLTLNSPKVVTWKEPKKMNPLDEALRKDDIEISDGF